ncbi:Cytochrome b-c1 complex subunit 6-1, mitochondrial-like protein [Drosera capensis]
MMVQDGFDLDHELAGQQKWKKRLLTCQFQPWTYEFHYPSIISVSPSPARADEESVDPKHYLEETCNPKCVKLLRAYQASVKRIQGDESGH